MQNCKHSPCWGNSVRCLWYFRLLPRTLTSAVSEDAWPSPILALQVYTYPPDWVSEVVKMLTSSDVMMMTDPPLWMSSVDDSLPRACFDQVNSGTAVVLEATVAVHVSLKLLKGGTSITVIWSGVTDTETPTAVNYRNLINNFDI